MRGVLSRGVPVWAWAWLAVVALPAGALASLDQAAFSLRAEPHPAAGGQGVAHVAHVKGKKELAALRVAVESAKDLIEKAKDSHNAAKAQGALGLVRALTLRLEETIGEPKPGPVQDDAAGGMDPMAHVHVDSKPKSTKNSYPALGITMDTSEGDGLDAPASNTLEVWGRQVAKERADEQKSVDEETTEMDNQFPALGQILSKKGNGNGFGTMPATKVEGAQHRSGEAELARSIDGAENILDQSKKTLGIVTTAVDTVVKLSEGSEQTVPPEPRITSANENDMWDKVRQENDNFEKKYGLLKFAPGAEGTQAKQNEERQEEEEKREQITADNEVTADERNQEIDKKLEDVKQKQKDDKQDEELQLQGVDVDAAQALTMQDAENKQNIVQATAQVAAQQETKKAEQKLSSVVQRSAGVAQDEARMNTEATVAMHNQEAANLDKARSQNILDQAKEADPKETEASDEDSAKWGNPMEEFNAVIKKARNVDKRNGAPEVTKLEEEELMH